MHIIPNWNLQLKIISFVTLFTEVKYVFTFRSPQQFVSCSRLLPPTSLGPRWGLMQDRVSTIPCGRYPVRPCCRTCKSTVYSYYNLCVPNSCVCLQLTVHGLKLHKARTWTLLTTCSIHKASCRSHFAPVVCHRVWAQWHTAIWKVKIMNAELYGCHRDNMPIIQFLWDM